VLIAYVDIDADSELQRRYNEHVPVIMLDGVELARHRLDPRTLADALHSLR